MDKHFTEKFYQNLLEEEFNPLVFNFKNYDYKVFSKNIGLNLYIVVPVYKTTTSYEDILNVLKASILQNINSNYTNIFFIQIIIEENIAQSTLSYIENYCNLENKIILIKWAVDIKNKQIIIKGEQPSKIIKLDKIINKSFDDVYKKKTIDETISEIQSKNLSLIKSKNTNITYFIILSLILVHFYIISNQIQEEIIILGSSSPYIFKNSEFYRLITPLFLHSNFYHLISNCLWIYIFGKRVEKYMGKIPFFIIYFLGGILSSTISSIVLQTYSIGASGAAFALEGALLHFSLKKGKSLDGFDFYTILMITTIGLSTGFLMKGVNNLAHIIGFLTGIVSSIVICKIEGRHNND